MAEENLIPLTSATPNDDTSLFAALSSMMRQHDISMEGMLPAIVVNYDRAKNVATVKPLITWVGLNDKPRSRFELAEVPALSIGAGNFHISFPISTGDLGWIHAADRDMALFMQTLKESPPNTGTIHKFSSGMFVPDVFRNYVINGEDSGAMVIQSTDSKTRISIRSDNIKITAPSKVLIDVPETEMTGNVTVDKNLIVKGTSLLTGMTNVNGGFSATGGAGGTSLCALPQTTTVAGITVSTHGHIQTGHEAGQRTDGGMV